MINLFAAIIGYAVIVVLFGCLGVYLCEYFESAKWYFTRFNSNKISHLEDVIYDAQLRIEQLKKEKLK